MIIILIYFSNKINQLQRQIFKQQMKERGYQRQVKRKSQEHFYLKSKVHEGIAVVHKERKNIARNSVSMGQFVPAQSKKRVNSLQIRSGELSFNQGSKNNKNSCQKGKSNINNCLSDRNLHGVRDTNKMFKYRKFSSNAEGQEQPCSGIVLKQKLSNLQGHKYFGPKDATKNQKYPLMGWMAAIRKFYSKQHKSSNKTTVPLNNLLTYIGKLQSNDLNTLKFLIDKTPLEVQLQKDQVASLIQNHFKNIHKSNKKEKEVGNYKVGYSDVLNSLIQYQLKKDIGNHSSKGKQVSSEEHEEAVQTARFQEGNSSQESKKPKKHSFQLLNPSKKTSFNSVIQHKNIQSLNESQEQFTVSKDASPLFIRSRQSLNPSLSPFQISQSQSTNTLPQSDSSEKCFFRKKSLNVRNVNESSIGMLQLSGKSPRQLMQSQIFQSLQRMTKTRHRQNISFSLDKIQLDSYQLFQTTVNSLQQILHKITKIQKNYKSKLNQTDQQPNQQVNLFLNQLINYKIAMERSQAGQHYSYFAAWERIQQFSQYGQKLLNGLLQSVSMREYFMALQGVKVEQSPSLYQSIKPLLHTNIKILNISKNNLDNLDLFQTQSNSSKLQLLNINNNNFTDITKIINTFKQLIQLHANNNKIQSINDEINEEYGQHIKIIDLSFNLIFGQGSLFGISHLKHIQIVNLEGNTMVDDIHWKNHWNGIVNLNLIYQMSNLYVMSDYGHHKDIAFQTSSNKYTPKNIINKELENPTEHIVQPLKESKQNNRQKPSEKQMLKIKEQQKENKRDIFESIQTKKPKQKISKIKLITGSQNSIRYE